MQGDRLVTQWRVMAIHHDTRRVQLIGITDTMNQDWMEQQARNLTDPDHGFLRGQRFLIMDRDPAFSEPFRSTLKAVGVEPVRMPPSSPNCNPSIERFFRSLKEECLNHCFRWVRLGSAIASPSTWNTITWNAPTLVWTAPSSTPTPFWRTGTARSSGRIDWEAYSRCIIVLRREAVMMTYERCCKPASSAQRKTPAFAGVFRWCAGGDSNPHEFYFASTSS